MIFLGPTISSIKIGSSLACVVIRSSNNGPMFKHKPNSTKLSPIPHIIRNDLRYGHICKIFCRYQIRPECGPKCKARSWYDCYIKYGPERQTECGDRCYFKCRDWYGERSVNISLDECPCQPQAQNHCYQVHHKNHQKNRCTVIVLLWYWRCTLSLWRLRHQWKWGLNALGCDKKEILYCICDILNISSPFIIVATCNATDHILVGLWSRFLHSDRPWSILIISVSALYHIISIWCASCSLARYCVYGWTHKWIFHLQLLVRLISKDLHSASHGGI